MNRDGALKLLYRLLKTWKTAAEIDKVGCYHDVAISNADALQFAITILERTDA